jgi:hypothetical protein
MLNDVVYDEPGPVRPSSGMSAGGHLELDRRPLALAEQLDAPLAAERGRQRAVDEPPAPDLERVAAADDVGRRVADRIDDDGLELAVDGQRADIDSCHEISSRMCSATPHVVPPLVDGGP